MFPVVLYLRLSVISWLGKVENEDCELGRVHVDTNECGSVENIDDHISR